ncbi:transglycosylase SLT domain-containing protein [Pseudoxanthomonas broegbernensis]|uniref:LysM peptidoglycan-binding domain-containing protein n=1 Tax=Pseudoxanthomonas broegbernensis TaxID=83619 RepID=UPI001607D4A0
MRRARATASSATLALALAATATAGTGAPPEAEAERTALSAAHQSAIAETAPDADAPQIPAAPIPVSPNPAADSTADPAMRSGRDIYAAFRQGLADPGCDGDDTRWLRHFAHAPSRLADPGSDALPLFGHVVDALREAHLPTEFALIPFIESGYAPAARAKGGPAGLWQLAAVTARHHGLHVGDGYDARLSPAESTRAAVRYLKTLNGMFGGNWRLAAMAYNAGEHRLLQSLRRSGSSAPDATPADLPGLSPITHAYVDKLHALACVLEQADERAQWRDGLDRPVQRLHARRLEGDDRLDAWARHNGHDPAALGRLNPALANGRWPRGEAPLALVPVSAPAMAEASTAAAMAEAGATTTAAVPASPRTGHEAGAATRHIHVVSGGESAWSIARRHGLGLDRLLELNGLGRRSVLRPGMILRIE